MGVQVVIDNKEFKRKIKELNGLMSDLTPVFKIIRDSWYKNNLTIFDKATGPRLYPDLKESYKIRKESETGFVYPILRGKNRRIEKGLTDKQSKYTVNEIGKNFMILGVKDIPYAARHQTGNKMPKRPFVFNEKTGGRQYQLQMTGWINTIEKTISRRIETISRGNL